MINATTLDAMQQSETPQTSIDNSAQLCEWIKRMSNGDEAALGFLYDQTLSKVFGLALRITGRRDLAEEVSVETYWQAWREAVRFDAARGVPIAWLLMIARSRALDLLRKQDSAISCPDPEILITDEIGEQSPLHHLLSTEQNAALQVALQCLTPIQRQMIALAFFKDLSRQEISDCTGLPLGTVKSHLRRAQDSLKLTLSLP